MNSKIWNRFFNNKEVKNAGWLISGKIIQMILSFLISVFTARFLGPSNYGLINYGAAYVAFFTSLCTLGINSVIIKDFVDNPKDEGMTIGTTIVLRMISSILATIMIIGIVSIVDHEEPITIKVTVLCSLVLVFRSFDTINYWFQARYQSKVTAVATLIAYIATFIYKFTLIILNRSVAWFAFATSVDYIFIALCLLVAYKRNGGSQFSFSIEKGKSLLSRSYHYILSGLMVAIYMQTDKLMLKQMLNEESVGYYSLASSVNLMWVFVLQAIIDSIYPTIMNLFKQGNERAFERKNRQLYAIVIYVSVFVGVMFVLFGRIAIILLYGKEFEQAAQPLSIIAWYTIFSYLGVARNAWIVCKNMQRYLKYMYLGAAVINVGLNYLFIPIWGASGAAVASLITQIMTSMILPCFIRQLRPNVRLMFEAFLLKDVR